MHTPDRQRIARWEALLDQSQRYSQECAGVPHRFEARLRRAIDEVLEVLRAAPGDPGLHLLLVRLHLAGGDDLALSDRVVRHTRWAALAAPRDPVVLDAAGDLLSLRGLLQNHLGYWREGVSLQRRARGMCRAFRVA
jgi:hypothetical protein